MVDGPYEIPVKVYSTPVEYGTVKRKPIATAGLFKMIYPDIKWVSRETVLSIHSSMISQHLIPPSKRTENVANAIADLADIGWFKFE